MKGVTVLAIPLALVGSVVMAQEAPQSVSLICGGAGSANRQTTTTAFGFDNYGNSATGTAFGQRSVGFDDQVMVEIAGNTGRIRMPRAMLPIVRGGKDGWFEIKDIRWGENEITGSVAVNPFNNPKLRLDRIQGHIGLSGKAGDFSGRCEPYDPARVERKF